MYTLEITESAESDLNEITDYLGITLANPQAAMSLLNEIGLISGTLESNPQLFPLCADHRLADLGYRKAIVRAYIMVYEIDEISEIVRILRIFHETENYSGKL